jgi:hypothetical protein
MTKLIDPSGVYVGEVNGKVIVYFAVTPDELLEDYAEDVEKVRRFLRTHNDIDGRMLWNGVDALIFRPATPEECEGFDEPEHIVCGFSLPTVPGNLQIN